MFRVLAVLALAFAGCAKDDVGTSVRLFLVYEDAWRLTNAELVISDKEVSTVLTRELLVLLPDEMAEGEVRALQVWGVRDGERIAFGTSVAIPRKGATVDATVVLERNACGAFCQEGSTECRGNSVVTCVLDEEGCSAWGESSACEAANPFCVSGACRESCEDECSGQETRCVDASTQATCGEHDGDRCREYSESMACPADQLCYGGRCQRRCTFGQLATTNLLDTASPKSPSLAFDAAGVVHAVYSEGAGNALRYGMRNQAVWTWSSAGATGDWPSIAIDAAGGVHLLFSDQTTQPYGLKYGYRPRGSGTWAFEQVRPSASVVRYSALAVDRAGTPHVVYYDSGTAALRYLRRGGAAWSEESVTTNGGRGCDLLVDSTGAVHVSYYTPDNDVMYALRPATGGWTSVVALPRLVSSFPAHARSSIGRTRAGVVHIAASDRRYGAFFSDDFYLTVTSQAGTQWNYSTVDGTTTDVGASPELAVDPFDGLHVVYQTVSSSPTLRYASRADGATTWAVSTFAAQGYEPAIGISGAGEVIGLSAVRDVRLVELSRACMVQ